MSTFKLANGAYLAHYVGGGNLQFLSLLTPGVVYTTTDAQRCEFMIDVYGNITY